MPKNLSRFCKDATHPVRRMSAASAWPYICVTHSYDCPPTPTRAVCDNPLPTAFGFIRPR
jgi:hypothetical protein